MLHTYFNIRVQQNHLIDIFTVYILPISIFVYWMLITFYIKLTTFQVHRSIFTFVDMLHLLSMEIKVEHVQWRMFLLYPYRLCFRVLMSSYSHAGCVWANKSHSTRRRTCSATKSLPRETATLRSPSLTLEGSLLANFLHSSMDPITYRGVAQYIPLVNSRFFVSVGFQNFNDSSYFLPLCVPPDFGEFQDLEFWMCLRWFLPFLHL
jgi:hypothetical protein